MEKQSKTDWTLLRVIVFLGALVLVLCGIARKCNGAEQPPLPSLARIAFDAGKQSYQAQRYAEAAAYWSKAYDLTADPALLFNIGQAYRLAAQNEQAIMFYRRFLRTAAPDAPNRDAAEAKLELLQIMQLKAPSQVARAAKDDPIDLRITTYNEHATPKTSPAPATTPTHIVDEKYLIAGVVATSVFALTALAFSFDAHNTYGTLADTCGKTPVGCTADQRGDVTSSANWATAFWIGTALIGGATGTALILDYQHTHSTQEASISLAGRF